MKSDIRHEQKRVDDVIDTIMRQIETLETETGRRMEEVAETRNHFWDEVKVNTDTFDDFLETVIALRQQAQSLTVSESTHKQAQKKLSALHSMKGKPYFGRIDFTEEGEPTERVYIGISTLTDQTCDDFLVYDWRAPISSVYYDYPPGPAEYTTPGGVIRGIVESKWQYLIRDGVIQSMFDTSLTIGDEILQEVLGKRTDNHMHSIVATIQQKQNQIIRHDHGRLLIVQGAAGSGKTSAALQRIAYLLYKYRETLKADQIVLFSPNSMFNSYVSQVLPELGEENMEQVTFQEYLDHRLSMEFQVEGPYDQLEYVLRKEGNRQMYETRTASIQFKASTDFFEAIKSYRKSLEGSGMKFKGIMFRGRTILTAEEITERFYSCETSLRFHNRLEKLTEWLNSQIDQAEKRERMESWVEEAIELMSNEQYHKARKYFRKRNIPDDYEVEYEALRRLVVRKRFKKLRKWIKTLQYVDVKGVYQQLFTDPLMIRSLMSRNTPGKWEYICRLTLRMLDEEQLYYEDATPFLLLKELILGFQTNTSIKHVLIDEAQDYSPFQFEFIKRLFPSAKLTVLGDFNQAIFAHANEHVDFSNLTELYGPDETDQINLTESYRSTKPIIDFTRRLVPGGEHISAFERDGAVPVITAVTDHDDLHDHITKTIEKWKAHGYHSIAVICKTAAESERVFGSLHHVENLKLMKSVSLEYEQGVVVIPAYLAKGIEFDAVIIYDASSQTYDEESLRRLFYTACTRAMHELKLYTIGKPTHFIEV
ncbi:UvrD-helicase domain-containing protein [Rossellomorea vietnamensis]|uniref:UvrD-helicase domain-containing protein n=1 Tax=Rossellomorea vietnamensis TaxID=218284 RepID=A0ACD4C9P6_9BACI|nr:RNA polymerase recycling motor HelD [Rossellomorea vietnamensis]UXH45167.1 UvrD-helicase domain-containing protein [Rossellomorea vietnamensis]